MKSSLPRCLASVLLLALITGRLVASAQAQGVGYLVEGGPTEGVLFPAGPLEVDKSASVAEPMTIEIADSKGGILVSAPGSLVPIHLGVTSRGSLDYASLSHAANVTWVFRKKGLTFEADGAKYVVRKSGATVRFTSDGVKMDGITKADGVKMNDITKADGTALPRFFIGIACVILAVASVLGVRVLRKRARAKGRIQPGPTAT